MTEILRSLLQILFGLVVLKAISIIAIPKRMRVLFAKVFKGLIDLICYPVEELLSYLFNTLKEVIKARKIESETVAEVVATSSEPTKEDEVVAMESEAYRTVNVPNLSKDNLEHNYFVLRVDNEK